MVTAHKITLDETTQRVQVRLHSVTLADSRRVIRLNEGGLSPVYYFPREDVVMAHLQASVHRTHCPFKGDAVYWNIEVGGTEVRDAVWSYEQPTPEVRRIAGYLAFYPQHVEFILG